MNEEMTISEMLREYNRLVIEALSLGLSYRERKSLKDRADGTASLEKIRSSIRAARGSRRQEEEEMVVDERPDPDFASLTSTQELVDCYNEMVLTAVDLGLTYLSKSAFESAEEGVKACTELHADIKNTREKRQHKEREESTVAKRTKKSVGARKRVMREATKSNGAKQRIHDHGADEPFALDAKIKVLVKENPKRGKAAERFSKYYSGMQVKDALLAGLSRGDLVWDVAHEFIKIF